MAKVRVLSSDMYRLLIFNSTNIAFICASGPVLVGVNSVIRLTCLTVKRCDEFL